MSQTTESKPQGGQKGKGAQLMAEVDLMVQKVEIDQEEEENQKKKFGFQKQFLDKKLHQEKFHH